MSIEQKIFERAKIDFDKLKAFGFVKSGNLWTYGKTFMDGDFKAVVQVDASGKVTGDVYETDRHILSVAGGKYGGRFCR